MDFEGGGALAFVDSRRFGRIRVAQNPEASPPISELGLDAFYELPEAEALASLLSLKQRAIKAVLLDQSVLCGIGNWVADEVLYQARIHPESPAAALTPADYLRLHGSIRHVLATAISVRADSSLFPEDWLFHVRWDKKPGSIGGHKITFITVGGRTSAVVPAVQSVAKASPSAKPISRAAAGTRRTKSNGKDIDAEPNKAQNTEKNTPKNDMIPKIGRGKKRRRNVLAGDVDDGEETKEHPCAKGGGALVAAGPSQKDRAKDKQKSRSGRRASTKDPRKNSGKQTRGAVNGTATSAAIRPDDEQGKAEPTRTLTKPLKSDEPHSEPRTTRALRSASVNRAQREEESAGVNRTQPRKPTVEKETGAGSGGGRRKAQKPALQVTEKNVKDKPSVKRRKVR